MIKYPTDMFFKQLDKELQNMCLNLNKILTCDVVATSGHRTPEHNAEIGGVSNSSHLNGKAIDLAVADGKTRHAVLFGAIAVGFKRIGIGKTHVHLDVDESKPFPTVFFDNYNLEDLKK